MPHNSLSDSASQTAGTWPAPPGRTVLLSVTALLAGWGTTLWLNSDNSIVYVGRLHAKSTSAVATHDGRIRERLVREAEIVESGATLAVLDDEGLLRQLTDQRRRMNRLKTELEQARADADVDLAWRTKQIETEMHELKLKTADYLKQQLAADVEGLVWGAFGNQSSVSITLTSADVVFSSPERLQDKSRISEVLKEEAIRNASEVFAAQIELCDHRLNQLQELKARLPEKIQRAAGVVSLENQLAEADGELNRLETAPRQRPLTAAAYGTVGVFRKRVGDSVAVGEMIVELLDEARRFLIVDVPSRDLSHFSNNGKVTLLFPGGEKRTGRVREIPPQAAATTFKKPTGADDALVPIVIDPAGKLWPRVPIGSTVDVRPVK